jgi:N-acetylneuraminate synthase
MNTFKITGQEVGPGAPCLVIGEVAQAHDGSLGMAHAFIDAIADAGADGVKFQTHIAAAESTPAETFRIPFSHQDESRYAYWQRMEFTPDQWAGLAAHAAERELIFLSSPFSTEAVELLERVGVPAWKIASGEVGNPVLFDRMAASGLPMLLSTGMSSWAEIDHAVESIRGFDLPLLVLQCTSAYPTPAEKVGLNVLDEMRERYRCPVGLSDHSGTIFAGLAGAVLGMDMLEVHVTLTREMFGPDVTSSVTPAELGKLVEGIKFIERALAHPVDKDAQASELEPTRQLFTRSVVAARDLDAGTILEPEHLRLKKPGTGLPPDRLGTIVGHRLTRALRQDELVREEDLA